MHWIKKIIKCFTYLLYLAISSFILLEVIFRFLPTAEVFFVEKVTVENPIIRFQPSKIVRYSLGWNFYQTAEKKTNNYGFVASKDYYSGANPELIVIGDSYVEAMQVDNSEAVSEVIEKLDNSLNVYSIGVSGVSISQYMKFVEYAEKEFNPKEFLIVIVGNDFDESLCNYRQKPGTYCFDENFELQLTPFYERSILRKIGKKSALARYAVFNLQINWRYVISRLGIGDNGLVSSAESRENSKIYESIEVNTLDEVSGNDKIVNTKIHKQPEIQMSVKFAGNTEKQKSYEIEKLSLKVVDAFVNRISSIANGKKVTIMIDANRQDIYNGTVTSSYFNTMRNYLIEKARTNGLAVIDMESVFGESFLELGERFEFPTDGHWNELGHELAAKAYIKSRN